MTKRSASCSTRSIGSSDMLSQHRYLVGNRLTEADWRLFTTLVRFDAVYYSHFKCNLRRIVDYPEPVELYRAISIRCRASPRRSISARSSGTITQATATSIRPASCRSARRSIFPPRTTGRGLDTDGAHRRSPGVVASSTSAIRARVAGVVSGGSSSGAKNPCSTISRLGTGAAVWRKSADHVHHHVVAARDAAVETDRMQLRRAGQRDVSLLAQLARQRLDDALADLDAAAGQMPAGDVAVAHQEDAALAVQHHRPHADGQPARNAPIQVQHPRISGASRRRTRSNRLSAFSPLCIAPCCG